MYDEGIIRLTSGDVTALDAAKMRLPYNLLQTWQDVSLFRSGITTGQRMCRMYCKPLCTRMFVDLLGVIASRPIGTP
jgi:hypothetical protein